MKTSKVWAIAKKEFRDHIRNRWIIALTFIFVVLTIAASYLTGGKAGEELFGRLQGTVSTLLSISSILIPLIAIMLGYSTISGEGENGALPLVLSYPITRGEVLVGKFLGLSLVLIASIAFGFGLGGIVIAVFAGIENTTPYMVFILLSILLGGIYLSLSIFFSAVCKKRSTSIGAGILIFFWSMIYGTIVFGIYLSTGGTLEQLMGSESTLPGWMWKSIVVSPMDMHGTSAMQAFGLEKAFGYAMDVPSYLNLEFLVVIQLLWFLIPAILAYFFFKRRDL
ncbi:hypothetical protein C9439_03335 [archaeon SCG-AAA382B04]|nr:hypothetical protein C9439_03335 [archaeon SCG-AAA382B04]